jgi:hypothetical protein
MGNTTTPEFSISEIAGNAPDDMKHKLGNMSRIFHYGSEKQQQLNTFAKAVRLRLKLTELSIINKAEEQNKLEGRAVLEIDVAEGKWKRKTLIIYYIKLTTIPCISLCLLLT